MTNKNYLSAFLSYYSYLIKQTINEKLNKRFKSLKNEV